MYGVNNDLRQIPEIVMGTRRTSTSNAKNMAVKDYLMNTRSVILGKIFSPNFLNSFL